MKKFEIILAGILLLFFSNSVKAENRNLPKFNENYGYENAVNFFERGIEFFVFTNGDFDFDTSNSYTRGVRINRDYNGLIRSVGNVFINYDRFGNVTRIGNIFMQYYRGRLTRVGDLRISYDRWNRPIFRENVQDFYMDNGIRFSINFGRIYNYNDAFFTHRDFNRNYTRFREDRDYFYYKANPNSAIGDRDAIIKRRKTEASNTSRNETSRNLNSYRKSNETDDNRRIITRNTNTNSRNSDESTIERRNSNRNTVQRGSEKK